jgi:hypothetical protein
MPVERTRDDALAGPKPPADVGLFGCALGLSAFLPVLPDGGSFARIVLEAFSRSALEGLMTLAGFGSPFVFGWAVFFGSMWMRPGAALHLVRVPISLMHAQLLLVALVLFLKQEGVAAWSLLGFAIVSAGYVVYESARQGASEVGPTLNWTVRWGAFVLTGIAAWSELQRVGGVHLQIALEATLVFSLGMLWRLRGAPMFVRPPDAETDVEPDVP